MLTWRWLVVFAFLAGLVAGEYLTASALMGHAQTVPQVIDQAAADYGVPAWRMHRIARCESGYAPLAFNRASGASGVYQWLARTWAFAAPRAGFGGASVWDAVANVRTAAHWMARGYWSWWACR